MFMVMMGCLALIVFMVVFSELYQDNMSDRKNILANDFGYSLQKEFLLASRARSGYTRTFVIPDKLEGYTYNVLVLNSTLIVNYTKASFYFSLPNFNGSIRKGSNTIRNVNDSICVNC